MGGEAAAGLIGVLLGGILGGGATYLMARRKGWSAARSAALLLIEELHLAEVALTRWPGEELPGWAKNVGTASWEKRREALTFRKGCYPSGLHARKWLELAATFAELRLIRDRPGEQNEARQVSTLEQVQYARRLLKQFEVDPPATGTFLSNLWRSAPWSTEIEEDTTAPQLDAARHLAEGRNGASRTK